VLSWAENIPLKSSFGPILCEQRAEPVSEAQRPDRLGIIRCEQRALPLKSSLRPILYSTTSHVHLGPVLLFLCIKYGNCVPHRSDYGPAVMVMAVAKHGEGGRW
jgi:hypothetical protein